MPITWNGVNFSETPVVEGGPDFSFLPAQESRYQMRGWFDWGDLVSQRATRAFCGWVQVAANFDSQAAYNAAVAFNQAQQAGFGLLGLPTPPGVLAPLPQVYTYFNYTLPYAHPDWPNQMYLCEGFGNVRGSVPGSPMIGPNSTAVFDEAHTTLHFRSPRDGYRTLPDYLMVDRHVGPGVPREYFCTRNMEIVEQMTSKAQSIPPNQGLRWVFSGGAGLPAQTVSAGNFITLHEGEVAIKWYPVPVNGYNEPAMLDLIGKCNLAPFPPPQPQLPGVANMPRSLLASKFADGDGDAGGGRGVGTLVMGQPTKRIVRMGNCDWAFEITLKMKWYPYGANSFFWWNPPAGVTGRIRIDPQRGPVADAALGGPGYYRVARPDGTLLFPQQDFRPAFIPRGQPA